MRVADEAENLARKIISERYPGAEAAFCAGSLARGEGTATSDIDLVVIFPRLPAGRRESFVYEGCPVEVFVHDPETLRYFFEQDRQLGMPSLPRMVAEGRAVVGGGTPYLELAAKILAAGPEPLADEQVQTARYAITDIVDDLRFPRCREEAVATSTRLYEKLGDFALRSRGLWSGAGKQLPRVMARQDPELYREFTGAFEELFRTGDAGAVIQFAEKTLAPHGGLLLAGHERKK
jgi:hypothetical protein